MGLSVFSGRWLLQSAGEEIVENGAIAVDGAVVVATGSAIDLKRRFPKADFVDFGTAIILPGLVNAHQHGRGLSQLQLGYADDALEVWIAGRQRHGPPDIYALVRLAADNMIANGVTATLHANYSYGSGDYEQELRETIRAYQDAGIRVTICVGLMDQGMTIYPDHDIAHFHNRLPEDLRPHPSCPYLEDADKTIALLHELRAEYSACETIDFAYGPAGPQWVNDATWQQIAKDAARHDIGIHFHLLESPAQKQASQTLYPEGVLNRLAELGVFNTRTSCAHATHLSVDEMQLAKELGLVIVTNPGSNMRLFNGAPPVSDFVRENVDLAVGTDNTALADNEDYLAELRLAGLLSRAAGIEGRGASARDLLTCATISGGKAAFLAEGYGRLVEGAAADFTVLDMSEPLGASEPQIDILDLVTGHASGRNVVCTAIAGQVVYTASEEDRRRNRALKKSAHIGIAARKDLWSAKAVSQYQAALRSEYGTGQ